ncbi:MAG: hypothetical protein IE926_12285 [Micrococcales bacterium]|nr:hypothetical protein [Micrococcales bacterium]
MADPPRADTTSAPAALAAPAPEPSPLPVAPAPKLRRRPALVAASLVLVCLGGLLAAWAWSATSSTVAVLAVRAGVERGAVVTQGDLMSVQVGADPALHPVPAAEAADMVGLRAASDIAAGTLLTRDQLTEAVLPGAGTSLVGIGLPAAGMPGEPLRAGDTVRVVATPGAQGEVADAPPAVVAASVVSVATDDITGLRIVTVAVPEADAAGLAARAATGNVALVLDSRER